MTPPVTTPFALGAFLGSRKAEVEEALLRVLPPEGSAPAPLTSAMRYSVLAGGKRLRPVLCLALYESLGSAANRTAIAEAATALELIHTYSLIHDDLPAMDDDSLRRGKPTCHVVHGEAMALLAGDALQTLGFEVLATRPPGPALASVRAEAVALVAQAIGVFGMAGGQALDLAETGRGHDTTRAEERLRAVHAWKTGKLLSASAQLGALYAGAEAPTMSAVAAYGDALGLLFQIADDLLDVTADAATLGKTAGKDVAQDKLTYPGVFGIEGALGERDRALENAVSLARCLGDPAGLLEALAVYAGRRDR